jgi:pilus assembly protein Flp/PilA
MLEKMKNLVLEEEGQALTEYGLIIALIAIAVTVGLSAIATALGTDGESGIFGTIVDQLTPGE